MKFYRSILSEKKQDIEDTYILRIKFDKDQHSPAFLPGQYCYVRNPQYINPEEEHPFSISSSPLETHYLEFCIKTLGVWTREFCSLNKGVRVELSEPKGQFVWDPTITDAVFLLGGIGVAPIMSMLRFIAQSPKKPENITMLYGNRTPDTIAYKNELEKLRRKIKGFTIIHIFSDLPNGHPWDGYRGFITQEIIEREIYLMRAPVFFMVGPPVFIEKMKGILENLKVPSDRIRTELLDRK